MLLFQIFSYQNYSTMVRDFGGKSWLHNGWRRLFLCVGLLNRVTRHYIDSIVNIIEELKEKYNYGKS